MECAKALSLRLQMYMKTSTKGQDFLCVFFYMCFVNGLIFMLKTMENH